MGNKSSSTVTTSSIPFKLSQALIHVLLERPTFSRSRKSIPVGIISIIIAYLECKTSIFDDNYEVIIDDIHNICNNSKQTLQEDKQELSEKKNERNFMEESKHIWQVDELFQILSGKNGSCINLETFKNQTKRLMEMDNRADIKTALTDDEIEQLFKSIDFPEETGVIEYKSFLQFLLYIDLSTPLYQKLATRFLSLVPEVDIKKSKYIFKCATIIQYAIEYNNNKINNSLLRESILDYFMQIGLNFEEVNAVYKHYMFWMCNFDKTIQMRDYLIDSKILNPLEKTLLVSFMSSIVSRDFHPKCRLLFRASENGYDAAKFHAKCDKKKYDEFCGLQVYIVCTKDDYVFGLVTTVNYCSSPLMTKNRYDELAFLFGLRNGKNISSALRYNVVNYKKAVTHSRKHVLNIGEETICINKDGKHGSFTMNKNIYQCCNDGLFALTGTQSFNIVNYELLQLKQM